mmetsp:Transcript_91900/g.176949  ORF Transcript_91900/g.176949 Transcript_91900/m.176949 type:complete len:389 (+) Transcript_91900:59-1225(+)
MEPGKLQDKKPVLKLPMKKLPVLKLPKLKLPVLKLPVLKRPVLKSINRDLVFSASLVCAFIATKSAVSLMLQECKRGHDEYPFVVQTVSVCAFLLQLVFYAWQTTYELGCIHGMMTLLSAWKDMAPAVFYSTLVALSGLLQTISQNYIDASSYIVLMQLVLVLVAFGDRFILKKEATFLLWCLVLLQTGIVISYVNTLTVHKMKTQRVASVGPAGSHLDSGTVHTFGIVVCLCAECCSATGCILQQQFVQVAKPGLPISIKYWYQHFFGVIVILSTTFFDWRNVERIMQHGFFGGWDRQVFLTMFCMWLYAVAASSLTAYLSALTAAMSAAMVVIVISLFEVFYRGRALSGAQFFFIVALVVNSGAYAHLKDRHNRGPKRSTNAPSTK